MTFFVRNIPGQDPNLKFITLSPAAVYEIAQLATAREAGTPMLSRSMPAGLSDDIFDRLDVDMANDAVSEAAELRVQDITSKLNTVFRAYAQSGTKMVIPLNEDTHESLIAWLNALYTYSRRDDFTNEDIGAVGGGKQGLDFSYGDIRALLVVLLEELLSVW